jgi:hypothetical protein
MTAFRRLHLRRPAALHRLSWLFTRFCPRFAAFIYVGSPLYTDMALYIDTFGSFCVC